MANTKILFLISLPRTKEFEAYTELAAWCVNQLREKGAEVRERIHPEDLAHITGYDIVIVVAHHDADANILRLADGDLSVERFVQSLPADFNGVLDFSSCFSASAKEAIKQRCPRCLVQVARETTRLAVRLVAYPFVIDLVEENKDKDYHFNYMEGLRLGQEAAAGNPEDELYDDDSVRLGQKKASVYAPLATEKKSFVLINVFIHYEAEKPEVRASANPGTEVHINARDLGCLGLGDRVRLQLEIMPSEHSQHLHIVGDETKAVTITDEMVQEDFVVYVDELFDANNFGCFVHLYQGEEVKKSFVLTVKIAGRPWNPEAEQVDWSSMVQYPFRAKGPKNLVQVHAFLHNNHIIPEYVDFNFLRNCIVHAYFKPLWDKGHNTFILHLMHKAKKGFADERKWAEEACNSVGIERDRLGKNPPSQTRFGEKMPDLEF